MMEIGLQSQLDRILAGASVQLGTRGLVHVRARNDMATTQRLGISWIVKDPTGRVRENYSMWEVWPYTGSGNEHEFIGGRFDIDKPGDWNISIVLYMNPDNPVAVDTYDGLLCRVTEEYSGIITRKELEYDGKRGTIPVT